MKDFEKIILPLRKLSSNNNSEVSDPIWGTSENRITLDRNPESSKGRGPREGLQGGFP